MTIPILGFRTLGVEAFYGFDGAFLTLAITGLISAVLVGFAGKHTGESLD